MRFARRFVAVVLLVGVITLAALLLGPSLHGGAPRGGVTDRRDGGTRAFVDRRHPPEALRRKFAEQGRRRFERGPSVDLINLAGTVVIEVLLGAAVVTVSVLRRGRRRRVRRSSGPASPA